MFHAIAGMPGGGVSAVADFVTATGEDESGAVSAGGLMRCRPAATACVQKRPSR